MASSSGADDHKLVTKGYVKARYGETVTLPCHISPETSLVNSTISWSKQSPSGENVQIYYYNCGQQSAMMGYEGRVTLNTQELQKGNVSLILYNYRCKDESGVYICQVGNLAENAVTLDWDGFDLVTEGRIKAGRSYPPSALRLPCYLSNQTSAVSMTIRWFNKRSQCIFMYKNGQKMEGKGYENKLFLNIKELQNGNVSLILRNYRGIPDRGLYICQVQDGDQEKEPVVELDVSLKTGLTAEQYLGEVERKNDRKESAHLLERELQNTTKEMEEHQQKLTHDLFEQSNQVEKLKAQLEERDNQLEKINLALTERDKKLEEKDQLLMETIQQLKQKEDQLEKKNEELRLTKKEKDDVITKINQLGSGSAFVKLHRTKLIERVTAISSILDIFLENGAISREASTMVRSKPTNPEKMRELYEYLTNDEARHLFYEALTAHEVFVLEELRSSN